MKTFNFKGAVSLTSEVTRRTTDLPLVVATPTEGNIRISGVGAELLGVNYDEVMDKDGAGQYIDIIKTEDGDMYIFLVPAGVEEIRGGKLAANAHGANLSFSNKTVYAALGGVPSSADVDYTVSKRWEIGSEGVDHVEGDIEFTFFPLTFRDEKKSSRRGKASNDTAGNVDLTEDDETDFS